MCVCVRTQNMVNGLDLYLGSQLICIVGFGFPTMGSLWFGDLATFTLVFTASLPRFPHKVAPFTLDMATLFPLFFSPESPFPLRWSLFPLCFSYSFFNPHFSFYSLI